ncbi:MAG: hypothetical protein JNL28_17695 [Planctomycetes bacterium]|nr:hypothetical protein [Planctomycetota bacterium]
MDIQTSTKSMNQNIRQLTSLKILSRLLGHELHAQAGVKTVQLSREEVLEIQTTLDIYIEEIVRRSSTHGSVAASEPQMVSARNIEVRN